MRPKMTDMHKYHAHIMSVGLGVQSTAMALMAVNEDIPKPTAMIFSDTGWEREGTYQNYERLYPIVENAGIPFHVVKYGNIRENQLIKEKPVTELPYYMNPSRFETVEGKRQLLIKDVKKAYRKEMKKHKLNPNLLGEPSLDDMLSGALENFEASVQRGEITDGYLELEDTTLGRQCTKKYKIQPVERFARKMYGAHHKTPIGQWLGISTDEWHRMSKSFSKAFELFYPLVDFGYSREDCIQYLKDNAYPVPVKSSCIGCPLHSDPVWREMSDTEIEDVQQFENEVNEIIASDPNLKDKPYFANGVNVHPSRKPISTRPFDKDNDNEDDMERDGVCGNAGCFL